MLDKGGVLFQMEFTFLNILWRALFGGLCRAKMVCGGDPRVEQKLGCGINFAWGLETSHLADR